MDFRRRFLSGLYFIQLCLASYSSKLRCKFMPGDPAWPNTEAWDHFNSSVDGRLIRTVPIASPCHGSNFDAAACSLVRSQWHQPKFQFVIFLHTCLKLKIPHTAKSMPLPSWHLFS